MQKKIGLIFSSKSSFWLSCRFITENLKRSYLGIEDFSYEIYHYDKADFCLENSELVRRMLEFDPEILVFLDHLPHPEKLLKKIDATFTINPAFIFHIYGCFGLNAHAWSNVSEILNKGKTKFILASHKQKNFLSNFVQDEQSLDVVPFPVDSDVFNFNSENREEFRRKFNHKNDDFIFIYSGRMSLQKNIDLLIDSFNEVAIVNKNVFLYLVGDFDDMGSPFFGEYQAQGLYFQKIMFKVKTLAKSVSTRIKFLGSYNHSIVSKLYQMSDCYISIGLHNDEDYGMAPAEASMCGLPLLLSNWGGFYSFKGYNPEAHLINVKRNENRFVIEKEDIVVAMKRVSSSQFNQENISIESAKHLSINNVTKQIYEKINDLKSLNFNKNLEVVADLFIKDSFSPYASRRGEPNSIYGELYQSYAD